MQGTETARGREIPPGLHLRSSTWAVLHRMAVGATCLAALVSVFLHDGVLPLNAWLYMAGCVFGLIVSRAPYLPLLDLFIQLQYRERLLVFVIHLAVFCSPYIFGYGGWNDAMAGVLVLLTFQAVRQVNYGRIMACTVALVLVRAMWLPLPAALPVALWMLALLISVRLDHVRFRVEAFGSGVGPRVRDFLGESVLVVILPWGIGTTVYAMTWVAFEGRTRELNLDGGAPTRVADIGPVGISGVLLDATILVAVIIATLVALHWLERKFRRRKPGETLPEEAIGTANEQRVRLQEAFSGTHEIDEGSTPRARILARFRAFGGAMEQIDHGRAESETAREYLLRLVRSLAGGGEKFTPAAAPFDRAAYSPMELSEEEALGFISRLDELEPQLREELSRQAQRERMEAAARADAEREEAKREGKDLP